MLLPRSASEGSPRNLKAHALNTPNQANSTTGLALSVVVPVYNGAETLRDCLSAVCNQTLPREKYEVLVIDDGSTDSTPEIVDQFPVRCVRLPVNSGRVVARATGAREAVCDDLVLCDARVICENDVLETVLACDKRPLMFGSDWPDEYHGLYGRLLFCVYRKLWRPYFPQCWYDDEVPITTENFDKVPKGLGLFATDRDFFLRHQPDRSDRYVSDDTLLLASMVREKPVIRYAPMRAHYRQRTELRHVLPHLHFRGALFQSYYLRPGHRFLWYYMALWALVVAVVASIATGVAPLWLAAAAVGVVWVGSSAALACDIGSFLAILAVLPMVGICFGSGIVRGQLTDLVGRLRSLFRRPR